MSDKPNKLKQFKPGNYDPKDYKDHKMRVNVAPAPNKEETIYINDNTIFYPDNRTGHHPPAPVYQLTGAAAPNMNPYGMYSAGMYPTYGHGAANPYQYPGYGAAGPQQTAAHYHPGWPQACTCPDQAHAAASRAYSIPGTPFSADVPHRVYYPGQPIVAAPTFLQPAGQFPTPTNPSDLSAQAAAAADHNKQLATAFVQAQQAGHNHAAFAGQHAMMGQGMGVQPGMMPGVAPGMMAGPMNGAPTLLAPYKPGEENTFWCRETDGDWTIRGYGDVATGEISPGHWERHSISGFYFWVRHAT